MIVSLSNVNLFEDKLKSILDNALLTKSNAIAIMVSKNHYDTAVKFMHNHKNIDVITMAGETLFLIKEMRVEVKKVDFYI